MNNLPDGCRNSDVDEAMNADPEDDAYAWVDELAAKSPLDAAEDCIRELRSALLRYPDALLRYHDIIERSLKIAPVVVVLTLPLVGCHDSLTEPTRDQAGQVVTGWHLTMGQAGPAIQQGQHGGFACEIPRLPDSVHYVEGDYRGPAHPSALTLTMHIEASPDAAYTGEVDVEREGHDTGDAFVTVMVRGADGERWWHGGSRLPLYTLNNASKPVTVRLNALDEWSDVGGQHDPVRFARAMARGLWSVGITMGGASFYGHGAALTAGSARFVVDSVEVQ